MVGFPGGSVVKNLPANAGDMGSVPGWGRSPGGGHGNPLQYACLRNPTDWGAWRAIAHRDTKSCTQPKWLTMHTCRLHGGKVTVLLTWVWCDSIWSQLWWGKNWWWISYVNFRKETADKTQSIKQCLKVMPHDQWGGVRFIGMRAPWMIYMSDKKWNIFLRWVHVDVWMYETKTSGKVRWGTRKQHPEGGTD